MLKKFLSLCEKIKLGLKAECNMSVNTFRRSRRKLLTRRRQSDSVYCFVTFHYSCFAFFTLLSVLFLLFVLLTSTFLLQLVSIFAYSYKLFTLFKRTVVKRISKSFLFFLLGKSSLRFSITTWDILLLLLDFVTKKKLVGVFNWPFLLTIHLLYAQFLI